MGCCASLEENQQMLVTTFGGKRYVENGPGFVCVSPLSSTERRSAVLLEQGMYAVLLNDERGEKRAVHGPCVEWMGGRDKAVVPQGHCPRLSALEYITVKDNTTGKLRNIVGPTVYRPGAYDEVSSIKPVYNLTRTEFIRVKESSGLVKVVKGEKLFVPEPTDEVLEGGIQSAVNIDEHHAVLVRNEDDGTLALHTEHGIFFPSAYQQILKIEEKIVLEEYQTVVYKDATGKFNYVRGDSELRDFFLPPFCEIVKQEWSTDLRKEHTEAQEVWKFDRRPSYMNYEFNCRTVDNVELVVDVSFFWAIIDVPLLVLKTADAPGDTCTHARSRIIQEVSRIKLLDFLEQFNEIIRNACVGDPFYEERGVNLISVEVLKFSCASPDTDAILQQIIRETADRLKKKERQKGENEVALSRLGGEIEEERMKKELIELKKSHLKVEQKIEGEAEAYKLSAFLERMTGKETLAIRDTDAMQMFMTMRKLDSIKLLADGASQLYLTPNDVNLSVGQMFPAQGPAPKAVHANPEL